VLSIEEVLASEAKEIHGGSWQRRSAEPLSGQAEQQERIRRNADERDGREVPPGEISRRRELYQALNKLNRAALCCSGGGIRSATFCLGVIQALAARSIPTPAPGPNENAGAAQSILTPAPKPNDNSGTTAQEPSSSKAGAGEAAASPAEATPESSLLSRFAYLSTVSGGGYVGSWLSSWRTRDDFATILKNLTGRPSGADTEPPEISWLRAYSNYLTPRRGIGSADTWAAASILVRNLILNWLIIIPVVCLVLLSLKLLATVAVWTAHGVDDARIMNCIALLGAIFLGTAGTFASRERPARRPPPSDGDPPIQPGNVNEKAFLLRSLLWSVLSAIAFTVFFTSHYLTSHLPDFGYDLKVKFLVPSTVAGTLIFALSWLAAARYRDGGLSDFFRWATSGIVYGAVAGLGGYLYSLLGTYSESATDSVKLASLLLAMIFGVPWMLMAQIVAEIIFVGLASYEKNSDSDREWLGRAGGWLMASAIAWALTAFFVFAGGYFVQTANVWAKQFIVASGGVVGAISGLVTAFLGKSSKTKATDEDPNDPMGNVYDLVLAIAGPIFAAFLTVVLSVGLDKALLGDSLVHLLWTAQPWTGSIAWWLLGGWAIAAIIGAGASWFVNINRFSLHATYRNRLIRCYLGASRQRRYPDRFTGFDGRDNIRVHELWSPDPKMNVRRMFHVLNITLNVVSTKRLAWQQRKAESFTVSPLHCGSSYVGFRPSKDYGDSVRTTAGNGIALGTAMAISGAAVSPNMGYYSSPSITLLMTLFNVRLGWWLGNPGPAGEDTYRTEGPYWAAKPLFDEAFGQTTDQSRYVYLSDGGHFEDLGLYEMVRRRCRFIFVIDAGEDAKFAFEDLGNAVRKIYIDLGIRIAFEGLEKLRNRPTQADGLEQIPYHAVGTIHYKKTDGDESEDGYIIYIKPAYHGTEGAGIISYATANSTFPHETTLDQWFTESQFESYRSLGLEIADRVLRCDVELRLGPNRFTLNQLLAGLRTPAHLNGLD